MPSRGCRGHKRSAINADSLVDKIRHEAEQSLATETKALYAFRTFSTVPINLEAIRLLPSEVVAMLLSATHEQHVLNFITSSIPVLAVLPQSLRAETVAKLTGVSLDKVSI